MSDPGYFGSDGCDERDYSDEIPEPEGWRHEFRDGSAIVILDMEDPKIETPHGRTVKLWECEEARNHIMEEQLDTDESIEYIIKNYK